MHQSGRLDLYYCPSILIFHLVVCLLQLNGRTVPAEKVKDMIASFNIQVDNLCQFLPQDKVSSFSSLDGAALLKATERALERPDSKVLEMHEELDEMKKRLRNAARSTEALREKIAALEALQANAERDVLRFKERERLVEEVSWLKKKLPWMKFESLRKQTIDLMELLKQREKELADVKERLRPYEQRMEQAAAEATAASHRTKPLHEKVNKLMATVTRMRVTLDQLANEHADLSKKRESLVKDAQLRERRVREAEAAATAARDKLSEFESSAPALQQRQRDADAAADGAERELEKAQQESVRTRGGKRQVDDRLRDAEHRLRELGDRERQKLQRFSQMYHTATTIEAYKFLHSPASEGVFQHQVIGPIGFLIEPKTEHAALIVETALPASTIKSFIVFSEADREALRSRFDVNAIYAPRPVPLQRKVDDAKKAQLKIESWLDEVIECDAAVMNVLLGQHNIAAMAICKASADPKAVSEGGIGYFFINRMQYTSVRARHGEKHLTTKQRDFSHKRVRLLSRGGNAEQERELRAEIDLLRTQSDQLNEEIERARERESVVQRLIGAARSARAAVQNLQGETARAQRQVRNAEERLSDARDEARGDLAEQRATLTRKINDNNQRRLAELTAIASAVEKLVETSRDADAAELLREAMTERATAARAECSALRVQAKDLEAFVIIARNDYEVKKKETREQKVKAETECPIDDEVRARFETMPDTEELVQSQIDDKEGRIGLIVLGTSVMREYTEREAQLGVLRPQLASADDTHQQEVAQLDALHNRWLPLIQGITAKLNGSFAMFMRELGCAGEVALQEDDDYAKWQLQIRVTFRNNEPLQPLSGNVHSGGERSVSTMLFLIAMQDLSDVPFRLVDEINQGMDPRNERAIFSLVVRAATRPNTPQYFLITPKLLLDLEYSEAATVLAVFNGQHMIPQEDYTPDEFIRAAAKKRRTSISSAGAENSRPQQQ
jgi:chromosome segregation ATPase